MNYKGKYRYWNGLITGLGISQLYIAAIYSMHIPKLKLQLSSLGASMPGLTAAAINPIVYLGVPLILISTMIILNFILRDNEGKLLISLSCIVMANWIALALIWYGINLPLLRMFEAMGGA